LHLWPEFLPPDGFGVRRWDEYEAAGRAVCGSRRVVGSADEREGLDAGMRGGGRVVDVGVRSVYEGREVVGGPGQAAVDEGEGAVEAAGERG
jgi:hypothetical protein